MTEIPNLYSFATKELVQDATLAYIDDDGYVALKSGGMVDVDATMSRLDLIRGFVVEAAERSVGSYSG